MSASPGRDPDAELEPLLDCEVADRERRAHGPLGIVLVRRRRAEERHHGVADELLDGAAVALELGADALVVRAEESPRRPPGRATRRATVKPTRSQKTTVTTLRSRRDSLIAAAASARSRSPRSTNSMAPAERIEGEAALELPLRILGTARGEELLAGAEARVGLEEQDVRHRIVVGGVL